MILVDKHIKLRVQKNNLIREFNQSNLQAASYDISISKKLAKFKDAFRRISFSSKSDIDNIYEEVDISLGYDLRPSEYVLVTLNEYISMPKDLCAHIRPRTSFIRLGLVLSHQHLNPTYEGNLSLGLYNASPFVFELTPNLVIGQIIFESLSESPNEDNLYKNKKNAKYHMEKGFRGSKVYEEFDKKVKEEYDRIINNLINNGD